MGADRRSRSSETWTLRPQQLRQGGMTPLTIGQKFSLDVHVYPGDEAALVRHLNDPEIVANTLTIPAPYREADAEWWLGEVARARETVGRPMHFFLRAPDGSLAGAVGFSNYNLVQGHRLEIGYWLGREHWGRGVMSAAVRVVCNIAIDEMKVARIGALVFMHNARSVRVLEKCGFIFEGVLYRYQRKNGILIDVKSFAFLPP